MSIFTYLNDTSNEKLKVTHPNTILTLQIIINMNSKSIPQNNII